MNIKNLLFGLLFLILSQNCISQNTENLNAKSDLDVTYENVDYSFKASVPIDWKIYREIKNDTLRKSAFIDWGIPKIYSEIENTEIENSVSIKAFKSESINNIQDLILNEYLKIDPTKTAFEAAKGIGENSRIIYHDAPNGIKYKGKSYFKYQNGLSYVITFMATPGTYNKNIEKFEQFYLSLTLE